VKLLQGAVFDTQAVVPTLNKQAPDVDTVQAADVFPYSAHVAFLT
jgi:hypothetical protein